MSNLNPLAKDPLAELRGYHLPTSVPWWPPAPGWWLLGALIFALTVAVGLWWWHRRKRQAAARYALVELSALRTEFATTGDILYFIRSISKLLRRFALSHFARTQVAGLTGNAWLKFLDDHGGQGRFQGDSGKLLVDTSYKLANVNYTNLEYTKEELSTNALQLAELVAAWIRYNMKQRP